MKAERLRLASRAGLAGLALAAPLLAFQPGKPGHFEPGWAGLLAAAAPLAALAFTQTVWYYMSAGLFSFLAAALGLGLGLRGDLAAGLISLAAVGSSFWLLHLYLVSDVLRRHQERQVLEDLEDECSRLVEQVQEGESALARHDHKRRRYSRLQDAATGLASTLELASLGDMILGQVLQLLQDKPVSVTLFAFDAAGKDLLRREADQGAGLPYPKDQPAAADALNQWVISRGTTLIVRDLDKDFRFRGLERGASRGASCYISPLLSTQGQVTGLVRVEAAQKDLLDTEDQRLVESLVVLASLALENAKLYKETQELAVTDGLTKLLLRRPLLERLEQELARSLQTKTPLSFILLDIDHFKSVNDTYGHPAGDKVLREIAALVKKRVRDVDLCGRYGGEEFAVLLPATDLKGAKLVAERIREGVKAQPFEMRGEQRTVTVSLGLATVPEDAGSLEELIQRADEALYRSKERGRDRSSAYGEG